MNTKTIEVLLDGKPYAVPAGTTLAALLQSLGYADDAVATAIDGEFVPRSARAARTLAAGEAVFLFRRIVGG
ncbi:MAG: sulfur carrier protein ThiS [Burkholderiaceae bacterium]|nr:sulfur carrier protein ThiS [Burkholderiaceae bacterium]MCX7902583.1 sulfur carrier protein ThiS [Burkholderiaceae bacterium]